MGSNPAQKETVFASVLTTRSSSFRVAGVVSACVMRKLKTVHKLIGLVIDKEKGAMWFEAVGPEPSLRQKQEILKPGALVLLSRLNVKASSYHSGGRVLDVGPKSSTHVVGLAPTHQDHSRLRAVAEEGVSCHSSIGALEGIGHGQKADVMGKVSAAKIKVLSSGQAGDRMAWQHKP